MELMGTWKEWGLKIAARKAASVAAKAVTSFMVAHFTQPAIDAALLGLAPLLGSIGITVQFAIQIDPVKMQAGLALLVITAIEIGQDWIQLHLSKKEKII